MLGLCQSVPPQCTNAPALGARCFRHLAEYFAHLVGSASRVVSTFPYVIAILVELPELAETAVDLAFCLPEQHSVSHDLLL